MEENEGKKVESLTEAGNVRDESNNALETQITPLTEIPPLNSIPPLNVEVTKQDVNDNRGWTSWDDFWDKKDAEGKKKTETETVSSLSIWNM